MKRIRCAGVPEHFNYPWRQLQQSGELEKSGIELVWSEESGGTGAMAKSLREGEIDMAIMLTEGAITDIVQGSSCKIISSYVASPLIWGVHTSAESAIQGPEHIEGKPFAISRYKSGSHLMAYVYAKQQGITVSTDDFRVVGNLDGARHSFKKDPNQLFLWEKYTTKPLVDLGEFRRIDECPTPWPSFIIVVREEFLQNHHESIHRLLSLLDNQTKRLQSEDTIEDVARVYHLELEDAREWFNDLVWEVNYSLDAKLLSEISVQLAELGILGNALDEESVEKQLLSPILKSLYGFPSSDFARSEA